MKDPTTERARGVVTLVILTVAVPSLLLTALAAVAVENEEAAAKKRTETAYDPVVWEIAQRFNSEIDGLVAGASAPFGEMVKKARGEEADEEEIRAFVAKTGDLAMNYFLIDPKGEVLDPPVKRRAQARCARDAKPKDDECGAMLDQLANLSHPRDTTAQVQTIEADDWRRVVVAQSIDGYFVGFELSACAFEPLLDAVLKEKNLTPGAHVELQSIQMPKEVIKKIDWHDYESRVLNWTLLKKSNLAWKMVILCDDEEGILSVTASRSSLYFWSLVLLVAALVAGIGYTIHTVSHEARMARLKTDFVSSVSHDLRTPLTSIRMFTETLLLGRASSKEEEREFLQVIADETDRLSRLTERILDFSRMEAGRKAYQFAPAELADLVGQAMRACRPMIEEARFEVKTTYEEGLPPVEVDRDAMVEVLINLFSNAIKYSPNERSMLVRAFREGKRIGISVSDRGIGIPKTELCKIFDKFYRVDSRRSCEVGGTGLGLSLVHHIVTAHGGEVTVSSTLDEGSTFTVWLPAPAEAAEPALEEGAWRASSS
jgi:signal transduction histidine kinase